MNSTSDPCDPMSADGKLGTAADYLASQVASKKADAIRSALPSMVRSGLARVRGVARRASAGATTAEDER